MVTYEDVKALLLLEVGAGLDGLDPSTRTILDKVTPNFDVIWSAHEGYKDFPGLRAAKVKVKCLDLLLGQTRRLLNTTVGPLTVPMNQVFDHLLELRKEALESLNLVIRRLNASRGPEVGARNLRDIYREEEEKVNRRLTGLHLPGVDPPQITERTLRGGAL
jgi:hypothetical protein